MKLVIVITMSLVLGLLAGCGDGLRSAVEDGTQQASKAIQNEAQEQAKEASKTIRSHATKVFTEKQLRTAIAEANRRQPLKKIRCPKRVRLRDNMSVQAHCTATTKGGTRVTVPISYSLTAGLMPGIPTVR
jgi:Na+-translocating ferredoxin:NAD+ oxidoreductase RnfG subunit